jgi:hypothetical protein
VPGDEVDDRAGHMNEAATDGETAERPDGAAGGAGGPAVEWLARRLTDEATAVEEPTEAVVEEPTGEWPAPEWDDWAREDTDPAGFEPVYGPPSDPFTEESEEMLPGWGPPAGDKHAAVGRRRILVVAGMFLALAAVVGVTLLAGWHDGVVQRAAGRQNGGIAGGDQGGAQGGAQGAPGDQGAGGDQGTGGDQGGQGGTPVSAPVSGRTAATFELVDGAGAVSVRAGDLGDDLYRISTPTGSGVTPKVVEDGGSLRLYLPSGAHGGAKAVDILLSTAVRWTVRLHGGVNSTRIDLNGAQVDAVDLQGGANRIDLALPAPKTVTAVRMSGGVDQFFVRLAGGTPVRVQVQDGAGRVTLAGDTQTGIAPGREFTAFGWTPGGSGVDLTAAAGMSGLTVSLG